MKILRLPEMKSFAGSSPLRVETFQAVVLSGGGVRGAGHLGALQYYSQIGRLVLEDVTQYAGTSIGALICSLLIVGYDPLEILEVSSEFEKLMGNMSGFDFVGIADGYGITSTKPLVRILNKLYRDKLGYVPTLGDVFSKLGKVFHVTVANITRKRVEYLSHLSDPDLHLSDAVTMSCNLPLIFKKIVYRGNCISDGGLADNFPISCVDCEKYLTLACIVAGKELEGFDEGFFHYIRAVLMTPIIANTNAAVSKLHPSAVLLEIRMDGIDSFSFGVNRQAKMDMCLTGYKEAKRVDNLEKLYIETDVDEPKEDLVTAEFEILPDSRREFENWDQGWADGECT